MKISYQRRQKRIFSRGSIWIQKLRKFKGIWGVTKESLEDREKLRSEKRMRFDRGKLSRDFLWIMK
jgi:hypothetical protein